MTMTLKEYLETRKGRPRGEFKPGAHYFPSGDYLYCFLQDRPYYAEPVTNTLTVYRAMDTKEIIGFKVYDVKGVVEAGGDGPSLLPPPEPPQ